MMMRAIRWVWNLKTMAVADSIGVKDGLAIHRKVEAAVSKGKWSPHSALLRVRDSTLCKPHKGWGIPLYLIS
jgi:hypothetical protein